MVSSLLTPCAASTHRQKRNMKRDSVKKSALEKRSLRAYEWIANVTRPSTGVLHISDVNDGRWVFRLSRSHKRHIFHNEARAFFVDGTASDGKKSEVKKMFRDLNFRLLPRGWTPSASFARAPVCVGTLPEFPANRFRVQKKIGSGAMGLVSQATDSQSKRPVALKTGDDVKALRKEVAVMRAIGAHGNLLELLDAFEHGSESKVTLALPLASSSLADVLDKPGARVTERDIWSYAAQTSSGLEYLHALRLVHCDLKPENILCFEKSSLKICDFGNTLYEGSVLANLYEYSRWYRPPEILMGVQTVHRSMDIWSFGVIALEMWLRRGPVLQGSSTIEQLALTLNLNGFPENWEMNDMFECSDGKLLCERNMRWPSVDREGACEQWRSLLRKRPTASPAAEKLVEWCMKYSPPKRASAADVAKHASRELASLSEKNTCKRLA